MYVKTKVETLNKDLAVSFQEEVQHSFSVGIVKGLYMLEYTNVSMNLCMTENHRSITTNNVGFSIDILGIAFELTSLAFIMSTSILPTGGTKMTCGAKRKTCLFEA